MFVNREHHAPMLEDLSRYYVVKKSRILHDWGKSGGSAMKSFDVYVDDVLCGHRVKVGDKTLNSVGQQVVCSGWELKVKAVVPQVWMHSYSQMKQMWHVQPQS
eukprot:gnl/MRDRNA2_/MRDRNA2_226216_c0_seq1.p2 gnl/MRDRNA2_/MRDRNA2_226216_c0~~gnl/MRDRNA2_/MRDRNA2_226216_c0_seq1.p2  ORF type:complete len:103 (+),score=20.46 gnl/MRDRNA2_/MRDRNA2_226216_c0_seq1:780-1088(+)